MLFKNGLIADKNGSYNGDLRVKDGLIAELGLDLEALEGEEVYDLKGKLLAPSFVDLHTHFREPGFEYKEDIESGSKAALRGGFTKCVTMGNTKPICDCVEVYQMVMDKNEELGLIDLHQIISVTKGLKGEELIDFDSLPAEVKFLSDDGMGILSNYTMLKAMEKAVEKGIGIMVHAEDPDISPEDYRIGEDIITARDIYLASVTGAKIHFSHVSTKGSIDMIREAKEKGLDVSCEVAPHHLVLSDLDYRVNPPIRTGEDVEALRKALADGTVDAIATDHAPHTADEKEQGAPGMIGLETAFPLLYTELVLKDLISLEKLLELMAYGPRKILDEAGGKIELGQPADLTAIDLDSEIRVDESLIASKSSNTPFWGQELRGKVEMTVRKGKVNEQ